MRLRRKSQPYRLLKYLVLGTGVLALSAIAPASGAMAVRQLIRHYFRNRRFQRYRFLTDLKNLQQRELIDYREQPDGTVTVVLTKRGRKTMLRYRVDDMKIEKPARWDLRWRLIMFDIPHRHRRARDAFRAKLKQLEFYSIQKSVFLTPYPCEDEIDFIASVFEVRKYVLILYVSRFEGEEKLRHHFGLS